MKIAMGEYWRAVGQEHEAGALEAMGGDGIAVSSNGRMNLEDRNAMMTRHTQRALEGFKRAHLKDDPNYGRGQGDKNGRRRDSRMGNLRHFYQTPAIEFLLRFISTLFFVGVITTFIISWSILDPQVLPKRKPRLLPPSAALNRLLPPSHAFCCLLLLSHAFSGPLSPRARTGRDSSHPST